MNAQYELGQIYEQGIGTRVDYTKALRWYHKAAKQGDQNSLYRIEKLNKQMREKHS